MSIFFSLGHIMWITQGMQKVKTQMYIYIYILYTLRPYVTKYVHNKYSFTNVMPNYIALVF